MNRLAEFISTRRLCFANVPLLCVSVFHVILKHREIKTINGVI